MWNDFSVVGFPYALWVLLPLIPSILIFLIFPNSTVTAQGPLAGLTVRAGGAFGAYLIIFAAIGVPIVQKVNESLRDLRQRFWIVGGYVELVDANGKTFRSKDIFRKMVVKTIPDPHTISDDSLTLRIVEGATGKLPRIYVEIPEFGEETVELDSLVGSAGNYSQKTIDLKKIQIKSKEAFPVSH
jgi:hypothetical protein